ncbi:MAG: hypothetical protein E6Q98_26400 [Rhodospirillaceae bacterium]|nr:MAG: hypothetical protein E6Q98_26400 [Rhodospirillaceae bacterium]
MQPSTPGDLNTQGEEGVELFARYAYAPNALGFCGPPLGATLRDGSTDAVRAAAATFSGVWPYLQVLSRMTGIADPLDCRLVESYWLGGGVGADLDAVEFTRELLDIIGPRAGAYWSHLGPDLSGEAAANHCFHVFGVYPWSRLLGTGMDEQPLNVLDNCRITWGTVLSREADEVEVSCRVLSYPHETLELSEPAVRRVLVFVDGYSAVPDVRAGDQVAVHWGRLCGRLTDEQIGALSASTDRQLRVTNQRLQRCRDA